MTIIRVIQNAMQWSDESQCIKGSKVHHNYYVYVITNKYNKVLYTGVTNDLMKRVYEHKHKIIKGFTSKYNVIKLVCHEHFFQIKEAIKREKQIKGWSRAKKIALIEAMNPDWNDLYLEE